jgi:hypothetical protein
MDYIIIIVGRVGERGERVKDAERCLLLFDNV